MGNNVSGSQHGGNIDSKAPADDATTILWLACIQLGDAGGNCQARPTVSVALTTHDLLPVLDLNSTEGSVQYRLRLLCADQAAVIVLVSTKECGVNTCGAFQVRRCLWQVLLFFYGFQILSPCAMNELFTLASHTASCALNISCSWSVREGSALSRRLAFLCVHWNSSDRFTCEFCVSVTRHVPFRHESQE